MNESYSSIRSIIVTTILLIYCVYNTGGYYQYVSIALASIFVALSAIDIYHEIKRVRKIRKHDRLGT